MALYRGVYRMTGAQHTAAAHAAATMIAEGDDCCPWSSYIQEACENFWPNFNTADESRVAKLTFDLSEDWLTDVAKSEYFAEYG